MEKFLKMKGQQELSQFELIKRCKLVIYKEDHIWKNYILDLASMGILEILTTNNRGKCNFYCNCLSNVEKLTIVCGNKQL